MAKGDYWVLKVVDAGRRETFTGDVSLTRDDAVNSLEEELNSMRKRLDNRRN